jgi:transcriptional regulator with XRE-family HTH domain
MESIGKRIRKIRLSDPSRTQQEFAAALGVTRGAVGNWELDKGVKRENLLLIAQVTGTSLNWLMTGEGRADVGADRSTSAGRSVESRTHPGIDQEAIAGAIEALLIALPLGLSPDAAKRLSDGTLSLAQTPPDRSIALSYPEQTRLRAQFLARQFALK